MIEQRHRLRDEEPPAEVVVAVRGGKDTVDKLRTHALKTARAWLLDGVPLFGISVFCALDDVGPDSLNGILTGRLETFRRVHLCTVGQFDKAGFPLVATGARPHFTVRTTGADEAELAHLLVVLGPARDNRRRRSPR
jgi:hypothetical protein